MKNTYRKFYPNVFVAACDETHEKGEIIILTTSKGVEHECIVHNFLGTTKRDGKNLYSITRTDGTDNSTIAQRKYEQQLALATSAYKKSSTLFDAASNALDGIVPGQPILVGHHSEAKHRAALDRAFKKSEAGYEQFELAKLHEEKAESLKRKSQLITMDMPESLQYFTTKLEEAREYHQGLKSGKYPRTHAYTLTYANKAVKDLEEKVKIATMLWGEN